MYNIFKLENSISYPYTMKGTLEGTAFVVNVFIDHFNQDRVTSHDRKIFTFTSTDKNICLFLLYVFINNCTLGFNIAGQLTVLFQWLNENNRY